MASKIKLMNILFDEICFILVLILFVVVKILMYGTDGGLYPTKRGFLCGDTSIQWPLKEESVPVEINDPLSYIIPVVVVSSYILLAFSKNLTLKPFIYQVKVKEF